MINFFSSQMCVSPIYITVFSHVFYLDKQRYLDRLRLNFLEKIPNNCLAIKKKVNKNFTVTFFFSEIAVSF